MPYCYYYVMLFYLILWHVTLICPANTSMSCLCFLHEGARRLFSRGFYSVTVLFHVTHAARRQLLGTCRGAAAPISLRLKTLFIWRLIWSVFEVSTSMKFWTLFEHLKNLQRRVTVARSWCGVIAGLQGGLLRPGSLQTHKGVTATVDKVL